MDIASGMIQAVNSAGAEPTEIAFNPLTALESSRLYQDSPEHLKPLVRRLLCQCGLVALMSKEETAQAMRDVLAETALRPIVLGLSMKADIQARFSAIDKWLDREEGKPAQTQVVDMSVKGAVQHTHNVELSAELLKEQIIRILHKPKIIEHKSTNGDKI